MAMTSGQLFSEYSIFRKNLNSAIRSKEMIDVNYKFDLDIDFYKGDTENIIARLNGMKQSLIKIQKGLK